MPDGDRTGPTGGGPQTGRGLGYCADNDQPGRGFGRGFGRRGRGRGWRNQSSTAENQDVRGILQQILDRLDKLEK